MAKIISLCIISSLLFLLFSGHVISRPEPMSSDIAPVETHGKGDGGVVKDRCSGEGEDECLMRSTLEAHIDYIYTQKQKQP